MALELQVLLSPEGEGGTTLQLVLCCYADASLNEIDFNPAEKERFLAAVGLPDEVGDVVVLHTWSLLTSSQTVAMRLGCQKEEGGDDYLGDWQMNADGVTALYRLLSAEVGVGNAALNFYFGQLLAQLALEAKLVGPRGDEPEVVAPIWAGQLNDNVWNFDAAPGP